MSTRLPPLYAGLLSCLLCCTLGLPASAQQVLVQNGATAQVSNGGVWNLQGATMDFGDAGATASLNEVDAGRVFGGQLTATRALNSPSSVDVAGLGAVLTAGVDLGNVAVTRGHTAQSAGGNSSIERFYDISPSKNNSGLSATLVQHYTDAELNGISESDLTMFKSDDGGSSWTNVGYDSRDASANTVTLSSISSFSRWTLGSESSPLPVEMAGLEGTRTAEGIQLTWRTASETGNGGFAVQRARGGSEAHRSWKKIGFVDGAGTTTEPQRYRFTDEDLPYAADTLAYRLRQVDTGGSGQVTDPVTVARGGVERLQLRETFPNPAQRQVTVRYAVPEDAKTKSVNMQLYDVLGRQVRTVAQEAEAGRHQRQLRVEDLASGAYVLRLRAGGETRIQRLMVVR